jgi:hypothetical protein
MSEASAALACHLAFWTRKNAAQMDRLFRQSKLMRPKWDDRRRDSTWGADVIAEAIAKTTEVYKGGAPLVNRGTDRRQPAARRPPTVPLRASVPTRPLRLAVYRPIQRPVRRRARVSRSGGTRRTRPSHAEPRGPHLGNANGLHTNLYVLLLGDPGRSRKSTVKDYATELVNRALPATTLPEQMTHEE